VRIIQLVALIAVVLTLPVFGVALAAPAKACSSTPAGSQAAAAMDCCDQMSHHEHRPGEAAQHGCAGGTCLCAASCSQAQAFDIPVLPMPSFGSSGDRVVSQIAILLTANSPMRLWRPPRAA
jgi:hypothetical protein